MTKEEFIEKYGDFELNEESNEMLQECCDTPELKNDLDPAFFLSGKIYNYSFFDETAAIDSFETNWDELSADIDFIQKIETDLEDIVFSSEIDVPYRGFVVPNFKSTDKGILIDFFTAIDFRFVSDEKNVYTNPLLKEISVEQIKEDDSLLMTEKPFEDYYEDVELMETVDKLFFENCKNIWRISFCQSYSFSGNLPIFFIGEAASSSNLIGLFSIGSYT
jgi:hypothetical protein